MDITYIILIVIIGILYVMGGFFVQIVFGFEVEKVKDLLQLMFWPLTIWFIK